MASTFLPYTPLPGIGVRGFLGCPSIFIGFLEAWSGSMTFLTLLASFLVKELLKAVG
ncbi:MAG: hypothetical protein VX063_09810 [SAR324 cluster bacterium]|nr:hypothetical protein [SAR324 cluster bacterium]